MWEDNRRTRDIWWITQDFYDIKLKEWKERQKDLLDQTKERLETDEELYITANHIFNPANWALEIFEGNV